MSKMPVGDVRPSQLLWAYGPGALIDLPNLSVITMGLDRWDVDRCLPHRGIQASRGSKAHLGVTGRTSAATPHHQGRSRESLVFREQDRSTGTSVPTLVAGASVVDSWRNSIPGFSP